jgi:chromosomal replication initiation ATPase DnaA
VETGIGKEDNPFKDLEAGIMLGAKRFKEKVARVLGKKKEDGELPQLKKLRDIVPIERIVSVCITYYKTTEENLIRRSRGKPERQVAIYLSKVLSAKRNNEVGDYFGINGQSVSGVIKAIEESREKDRRLRRNLDILKEQVLNGK